MLKINSSNTSEFFIKYFIRTFLSSVISVALLSAGVALIFVKFDIDLLYIKYGAYLICAVSGFIIPMISTFKIKNNLLILSVLSVTPLALFSVICAIINNNDGASIIINIILIVIFSVVSALIKSGRKR